MSSYLSIRSYDCSGLREADSSGRQPLPQPSRPINSPPDSSKMTPLNLPLQVPPHPGKDLRLQAASTKKPSSAFVLSQFQQQMSQMKEAMDAVQKEILSDPPPPQHRGRGRPPNPHKRPGTYHSQLAKPNGLVIKIRKGTAAAGGSRGGRGATAKKRRKRVDEDIVYCREEDSETEEEEPKRYRTKDTASPRPFLVTGSDSVSEAVGSSGSASWGVSLPLGVLKRILALVVVTEGAIPFLVRASRVSRLWREATLDPTLWTSVDLSTNKVKDKYRSERNLIYFLENKFSEARILNLGGWSSAVTPAAFDVLLRVCPHLTSLNLSTCNKLTAQNVKALAESCPNLSILDLSAVSAVYNTKNAVSPSGIGDAIQNFAHRLLHLSLASNCMGNLPQVLTSISENCVNLQVLDLSNVNSPRRDAIVIRLEPLQMGCPSLKVLRLTNTDIALAEVSFKDHANSPGFAKLEELSIAVDPKKSQGMDNNDLERIAKNAHRLRLLDARGCSKISDSCLVRLPAWDLEHLFISGSFATKSSADGLELMFRKWAHSLKEVDISWTPSEEGIALALKALAEADFSPLRSLDLSGSSISFESVQLLLRSAVGLQSLNLTSCRALPRGLKRNYTTEDQVDTLRQQVSKVQETSDQSPDLDLN